MADLIVQKPVREFIDLDFMFTKHPETGNIMLKRKQNAVRQSVLHLLQLRKGDKPFHPEIYSPVYEFMFELATPTIRFTLEAEVAKYLAAYEPRLNVQAVNVSFPTVNSIKCDIVGILVNTTEPFTITYFVDRIR
jgi:phage baseplate assembly protein W